MGTHALVALPLGLARDTNVFCRADVNLRAPTLVETSGARIWVWVLSRAVARVRTAVRLVRQANDRRLSLAGPAVRLDRYEHALMAGSAGHGPVRLLASFTAFNYNWDVRS